jgi:hypothetical protein
VKYIAVGTAPVGSVQINGRVIKLKTAVISTAVFENLADVLTQSAFSAKISTKFN